MTSSVVTKEFILRPIHGARFVNWVGGDVHVQFAAGQEKEVIKSIREQLDRYESQILQAELLAVKSTDSTIPPSETDQTIAELKPNDAPSITATQQMIAQLTGVKNHG